MSTWTRSRVADIGTGDKPSDLPTAIRISDHVENGRRTRESMFTSGQVAILVSDVNIDSLVHGWRDKPHDLPTAIGDENRRSSRCEHRLSFARPHVARFSLLIERAYKTYEVLPLL